MFCKKYSLYLNLKKDKYFFYLNLFYKLNNNYNTDNHIYLYFFKYFNLLSVIKFLEHKNKLNISFYLFLKLRGKPYT